MGADVYEAYLYALEGSCVKIPTKKQADAGKTVFLSMNSPGNFAEEAAKLASLGFTLVGSGHGEGAAAARRADSGHSLVDRVGLGAGGHRIAEERRRRLLHQRAVLRQAQPDG